MAAKLTVVVLLFVVAFAQASIPSDQVEDKILTDEPVIAVPDPESKATILLPSEKPVFDLKPDQSMESVESETTTIESMEENKESEADHSIHLTMISFRPTNRHFLRRPWPLSSRRGRPCHLHRSRAFKRGGFRPLGREIPYGNDMILSDEDLSFVPKSQDGIGRISARWLKPHHEETKHSFRTEMDMREDREERTDHRHHHHHQYHPDQDIEGKEREHRHEPFHHRKHDVGLMMKFRKFLNNL